MTDNTEPTIDKIIDELLAEAIEKAITEWAGQEYPNDATFYDVTVKEAKQAIKALIANQVAEARIDELERLLRPFLNKRVYGVNAELTINAHNRIVALKGDDK